MPRISKRTVDGTKPGRKRAFLWDSKLSGFGLLLLPSGAKSFVFQYRTPQGHTRRATIAKAGTVTPDEARTLAENMARTVKLGGDPLQDKNDARNALTVGDVLDRYLASAIFATKADKVQRTGRGEIERHLRPLLGRKVAAKLEPDDVRRCFASIAAGKTAKTVKTGHRGLARVRGGEGVARHSCRLLKAILRWAKSERLIERDPTEGIGSFGRDGSREAVLDAGGYARLFSALAKLESEHRVRPAVADCVRLIALTGCRRGEATGLRWRNVDLKNGRVVLTKHKTARSSGKPRVIHLPSNGQQIVARQPAGGLGDYVFSARDGGPVLLATPWRAIRREAGLPEDFTLHSLRHALGSSLAVDGAGVPEIMSVLGHAQPATAMKYVHFVSDARAKLAERAAKVAVAGMAAAAGTPKADVVRLKRRP